MENQNLIPANSKKSLLIFGFFTWKDFNTTSLTQILLMCMPLFVTLFLVMPVPNYHNVMTLISNVISFYTNRRRYIWKGWCVKDVFRDR